MKKRILAAFMVLVMAGSMLTGCKMTDSSTTEPTNESGEKQTDSSVTKSEGEAAKGSETASTADAVSLDLYLDFTWFPVDSWTGIIPEALTEKGGVRFDVTRAADDSQLGLMIASGDLPDVIFTDKEIDRLSDSNLCYSYSELIEKYGLDWAPSEDRVAIAKSHNVDPEDENFYTIIQNYNTNEEWQETKWAIPTVACLYYRKDILKELGNPEMKTLDDLMKVCEMVKEKYPDITPINAGSPAWRLGAIMNWFGSANEFLYTDGETVAYRDTTEEFYNFLKYANQMYLKGFFPEENLAITNEDDGKQIALNGKCFIYEWCTRPTNVSQLNTSTKANVPDAEWGVMPIPDESKEIARGNAGWAGVFISKNCKDPEAAIRMIAYMNSEEGRHIAMWGREGIDYTLDDNGVPVFSEEWLAASADSDMMYTKYNNNYFMCTTELDEAYSYYSGADPQLVADFTQNSEKLVNYPELAIAMPVSTSDMGIVRAKLNEARQAEIVKLYTAGSDAEFESYYKAYMDLLRQIGVDDLNDYMTTQVKQIKKDLNY